MGPPPPSRPQDSDSLEGTIHSWVPTVSRRADSLFSFSLVADLFYFSGKKSRLFRENLQCPNERSKLPLAPGALQQRRKMQNYTINLLVLRPAQFHTSSRKPTHTHSWLKSSPLPGVIQGAEYTWHRATETPPHGEIAA